MKVSDEDIILRLKRGDDLAYKYLFDHHYKVLCAVANGYLKDMFLAETIVGDLIFHLWEKREELNIQTSLRGYLLRAVRNRCLNYLQQEYVRKETDALPSDDALHAADLHAVSQHYPLTTLLEKELEHEISKSIEKLPNECRTVFEMSRFEQMKYLEIATKLGISVNTVKYHIKNALAKLSQDLNKYFH